MYSKFLVDLPILALSYAVPHKTLNHYDANGNTHHSILQHRAKRILVEGTLYSECVNVEAGVTQGTVLASLLFLLHIQYISLHVASNVRLLVGVVLLHTREPASFSNRFKLSIIWEILIIIRIF